MQTKIQSKNIAFGVDGSLESLSMAFFEGESLIDSFFIEKAIHSIVTVSAFDALLKKTHLNFSDINDLYITIGPGRYSSLRVTLSIIKGLFFNFTGLVYCINTMDLVAAGHANGDYIYVSKKTSKGEIIYYYNTIPVVKRLDGYAAQNCKKFDSAPNIKNMFRIDKQFFMPCSLSSIAVSY